MTGQRFHYRSHPPQVYSTLGPYAVLDVTFGKEEREQGQTSLFNRAEAQAVLELLRKLYKQLPKPCAVVEVGIISPYKQQVEHLLELLQEQGMDVSNSTVTHGPLRVEVKSVDGFQAGASPRLSASSSASQAEPLAGSSCTLADCRAGRWMSSS